MGYASSLRGAITISPPLRWSQFKDSDHLEAEHARDKGKALVFRIRIENVDTDDGPMERRTAVALDFAWPYPVKLYDVVEELQALVDAYPDHEFVGEFQGTGADFGDIWLLRVNDERKAERILPTITWPDGTVLVNERYKK